MIIHARKINDCQKLFATLSIRTRTDEICLDFQLKYAYNSWVEERASWRAVIQLNLIRSVNQILEVLTNELQDTQLETRDEPTLTPRTSRQKLTQNSSDSSSIHSGLTAEHKLLSLRLRPLRQIQKDLEVMLGLSTFEPKDWCRPQVPDLIDDAKPPPSPDMLDIPFSEPSALSTSGWKSILSRVHSSNGDDQSAPQSAGRRMLARWGKAVSEVLSECKGDIKSLWADEGIQDLLKIRKMKLEHLPGFFLGDVDRIADRKYEPSDDDVIRARLRTTGVQEFHFHLPDSRWIIYDVSGSRTSRASWVPFFDDVNAIIFVAPISCFDEQLAEDRMVNRLEDSFNLWKEICSNKLLAKVQFILFLNKCDLLAAKLKRIQVRDSIPDFKDRNNDFETVTLYFHDIFQRITQKYSKGRPFFVHFTSAVDTKATAVTLEAVKQGILLTQLKQAGML
jgi:hypothetical protein